MSQDTKSRKTLRIHRGRFESRHNAGPHHCRLSFRVGDGWQQVCEVELIRIDEQGPGPDDVEQTSLGVFPARCGVYEEGLWWLLVTVPDELLDDDQANDAWLYDNV